MASKINDQGAEPEDYLTMMIPENKTQDDATSLAPEKRPTTEEALSKSILSNSSSVGLKIMQRMGFDVAKGLGKNKSGAAEPIKVDLKRNRLGIGSSEPVKRIKSNSLEHFDPDEYRHRKSSKSEDRLWAQRVRQAQTTLIELENFDILDYKGSWIDINPLYRDLLKEKLGLDNDVLSTNDSDDSANESDNEMNHMTDRELFEKLNYELRSKYSYCFWCGSYFGEDYDYKCPGMNESDHD